MDGFNLIHLFRSEEDYQVFEGFTPLDILKVVGGNWFILSGELLD